MMSFIGDILGGIGSLVSGGSARKASNAQANLLQQEQQQQAQEFAQMMGLFKQLTPFFQQYMGKGSPILNQVQTGSTENVAREYGGAEAETAEKLGASGYGFTPSGTTAGAFGDIESAKAEAGSNTFLQNLLANEATKFQAANGLMKMGETLKPGPTGVSQTQPSPTGQALTQIGSGVSDLSKKLGGSSTPSNTGIGVTANPTSTSSYGGFSPPGVIGFEGQTD